MRTEFKKALARGGELDGVKSQLIAQADREHQRVVKSIERDYLTAKLVSAGLEEDPATEAYKVARAFRDDCDKVCGLARTQKRKDDEEILRVLKGETELDIPDSEEVQNVGSNEEAGKGDA